ncbi:hypothetical protein FDK38_002947 [Candidozyma auris]|nr:hypothetical protein FDK38_002947 [[Candida] auris]
MPDNLTVYNAHNGESVQLAKPVRYHTLASFKDFLLETFTKYTITAHENIFLLTSFGMKVNYGSINEMSEVYVFDKRLFNASRDPALVSRYLSTSDDDSYMLLKPTAFSVPETSQNVKVLSSALRTYETWVNARLSGAGRIEESIEQVIRHINTIFKSLSVLFQFAAKFVSGTEKNFDNYFNYVKNLNQKSLHTSWQDHYDRLKKFPRLTFKSAPAKSLALVDFLDLKSLKEAAAFVEETLPEIVDAFNRFSETVNKINQEKLDIDGTIEELRKESMTKFQACESSKLAKVEEISSMGKSIRSELETTTNSNTSDLSKLYSKQMDASKTLYSQIDALFQLLESLYVFKKKLVKRSLSIFEKIASLQMQTVNLKTDMKRLLLPTEQGENTNESSTLNHESIEKIRQAGDHLSLTVDLPLLYGFLLIEKRRQYEWHDFYSRGVVSNVSEQLTVLIEHEKAFQKLWLKKFGGFLKFLASPGTFRVQLPTIDVTLVNGDYAARTDSVTEIIADVMVEREDVTNYINTIRDHSSSNGAAFSRLLEKNFKDLVRSTDGLKRVTKLVSSIGSYSPEQSQIITRSQVLNGIEKPANVTDDVDLNLIRGLRMRIVKLEGLLHQQQYNNISNWPVVKSSDKAFNHNKDSLLVEDVQRRRTSSSVSNPTNLLSKGNATRTSSSNNSVKAMDASTTIDKHVDNIRLRKELNELKVNYESAQQENESLRKALEDARLESQDKDFKMRQLQLDFEEKIAISESVIKDLGNRHAEEIRNLMDANDAEKKESEQKYKALSEQFTDHESMVKENQSLKDRIASLEETLEEKSRNIDGLSDFKIKFETLKDEFNELQDIKQGLLSNMHAKEAEYITERSQLESEIKALKEKSEEMTEDYENLMEVTQTKHRKSEEVIGKLNAVCAKLFEVIRELSRKNFDYFEEFCYVLESMGLLLVKEADTNTSKPEYKIRRVKGLRSRKNSDVIADNEGNISEKRFKSTVVAEIEGTLDWLNRLSIPDEIDKESENDEIKSNGCDMEKEEVDAAKLIETFQECFEKGTETGSNYAVFMKLISFNQDIQLQFQEGEDSIVNSKFFLNGIFKRFKDVEGFAKKLAKENKAKIQELNKLSRSLASKISVNDFQNGDLVLFLPTRVDRADGRDSTRTPWTAFNIEAPNYFLDDTKLEESNNREYIVSRIGSITKKEVTEDNFSDSTENPFSLHVGVIWYMIQAE